MILGVYSTFQFNSQLTNHHVTMRLAGDKHSSLLWLFFSLDENGVLRMWPVALSSPNHEKDLVSNTQ